MSATARKTLRTPAALAAAQLVARDRLAPLEEVAARYAVAITPAIADLIDPSDPPDLTARQFVPDARELHMESGESQDPIGARCTARSRVSCTAIRTGCGRRHAYEAAAASAAEKNTVVSNS
jgi:L-lysine 2,3-aminomutase